MGGNASPDVSAARDRLPLTDKIARADEAAVLLQVDIPAARSIVVLDTDVIAARVSAPSIAAHPHFGNDPSAGCADRRPHRHREIIREFLGPAMTDYSTIALRADVGNSRRPGQPIR